ncbi:guanylate cyclase [Elysia marginata]|uniref:Guanylate cyclase n=1 Tax=Elysia marginata TaxID=1093978 RepID=A0AAV4JKZ4_9GAST|nr:guanylate cyclase [Elysia marginata]
MHKGTTKTKYMYMTNFATTSKVEIEKVKSYKYLAQTTFLKDTSKEEVVRIIRAGWSCLEKNREIFMDDKMLFSLKRQVFDHCVIPTMSYGCQTWSLTKAVIQRIKNCTTSDGEKNVRHQTKRSSPKPRNLSAH